MDPPVESLMQPAPLEAAQRLRHIAEILARGYRRWQAQQQLAARWQTVANPEKIENSAENGLALLPPQSVTGDNR